MTVAAYTVGCKVNQYETEAVLESFTKNGYEIVPFNEKADVYIINTCSVTAMSDSKNRQAIRKCHRLNPDAIIAVMGCYSQVSPEQVSAIEGVDIILGTQNRNKLFEMTQGILKSRGKLTNIIPTDFRMSIPYEDISINTMEGHTRAFIKIQDGCSQFCTYCIIPYARGPVRSRSSDSILDEVNKLALQGFKEIVLVGIHLSSYGKDLSDSEESLQKAVNLVSKVEGIKRVRLGSLEPMYFNEDVIKALSENRNFCRHFHLSLQSGSDSVLKRMNRKYTSGEYLEIVNLIRKYMPESAITTDIMVGFPGETEEEFNESYEFVKKVNFSRLHVFPYSSREGTVAAKMSNKVPNSVKKERVNKMIALGNELESVFLNNMIGKTVDVLCEKDNSGYTDNYVRVLIEDRDVLEGDIIPVVITGVNGNECIGKIK